MFVGERRSRSAIRMGVHWEDGRLAAKQLFDALLALGIDPQRCEFVNWWERGGRRSVRQHYQGGGTLVGLGRKVQKELTDFGLRHLSLTHPAARPPFGEKIRMGNTWPT
jgi:hypothetical protein